VSDNMYGYLGMGLTTIVLLIGMTIYIVQLQQKTRLKEQSMKTSGAVALEGQYRALAEESVLSQRQSRETAEKLAAEMSEIKQRLTSIEKLLKDVQ